jgi:hypothetical protein
MSINTARQATCASNADKPLRRQVVAYWRALLAMLPCNRSADCRIGSVHHSAAGPGQRP